MSTSLEGLNLFMKAVLDAEPWNHEPGLAKSPWLPSKGQYKYDATRKLKIAVMWHDGVVKPHPPVTRALNEVVSRLQDLDWIEVVDWEPYKHDEACKYSLSCSHSILRTNARLLLREHRLRIILPRQWRHRSGGNQSFGRADASSIKMDYDRKS